jgi:hypothetical protein
MGNPYSGGNVGLCPIYRAEPESFDGRSFHLPSSQSPSARVIPTDRHLFHFGYGFSQLLKHWVYLTRRVTWENFDSLQHLRIQLLELLLDYAARSALIRHIGSFRHMWANHPVQSTSFT